jgi:hypothetical protein
MSPHARHGSAGSNTASDQPHVMSAARLDDLRAQAQYARQRYDLYKAKAYSQRLTSPSRMRELERACARAEAELRFAEAEAKTEAEAKRAAAQSQPAPKSSSHGDSG